VEGEELTVRDISDLIFLIRPEPDVDGSAGVSGQNRNRIV